MTKATIWTCHCGEAFEKASFLSDHTDTTHVTKVVIDMPVLSKSDENVFTRQIDGKFHCIVCQSVFLSASKFKKHLAKQCFNEEKHTCSRCKLCFDTHLKLITHLTSEHGLDTMVLAAPIGIKESIKLTNKSNNKFECPFCPNEYDTLPKLTQHVQHRCDVVKESNNKSDIQCEKCDEKFTSRKKLAHHTYNRHLETVKVNIGRETVQIYRDENDKVTCPLCKVFTSPAIQTLVTHMQSKCVSSDSDEYRCDECSNKYKLKSSLYKHKYSFHSPAIVLKYQSSVSGKWKSISKYRTPTNELHCPSCGTGYKAITQLIDHVSNKCTTIRDSNNAIFKFASSCIILEKTIDLDMDKENYIVIDDD